MTEGLRAISLQPAKRTRSLTPSCRASAVSRARSGPSPTISTCTPGSDGSARRSTSSPFWRSSRAVVPISVAPLRRCSTSNAGTADSIVRIVPGASPTWRSTSRAARTPTAMLASTARASARATQRSHSRSGSTGRW
jgi:hypothetical protein